MVAKNRLNCTDQESIMYSKNKIIIGGVAVIASIAGLMAVFAAVSFDPNLQPVGYVAQPAASNFIVSSGNEKLYAVDYKSTDWSGNLHSYNLSAAGAMASVSGVETDNWVGGAAAKINAQNFNTGRNIVTFGDTNGVPFKWASGISATQKAELDPTTAADTTKTTSPILDYIRGDFSKQLNQTPAGTYRSRTSKLGDIIHSTPVFWNDRASTPTKTVFVGANDGMLHAINAVDGTERFAYIPSVLIPELSKLTNPTYTHRYYVDGRLDASNFGGGTQTILAGALGAGGKGLFGLDITTAAVTAESDAASKILWEITNTGIKSKTASVHNVTSTAYANLGYTYGAPTLLTLPDGTSNGTKALVVGNGYNNTGNGHATLFLINAETGGLIKEIDTGVGTVASPNGLSTPTFLDSNGDGKKDTAYAGDIDGNLWKFSLVAPYGFSKLHATVPAQAITTAPSYKAHPLGGYMINFVTGRMLTPADKLDTSTHYAYGIWDGAPNGNNDLLLQTLTESTYTSGTISSRVRTASNNTPDWFATHKGWKTELPVGGERLIGDGSLVRDSVFLFLTSNPLISPNATPPGENWWMQLNAITGGSNDTVQFDLNKDAAFNSSDEVTVGTESLKPVGRHFGGGVRSQFIQLSTLGNDVFQSNYDKNGSVAPGSTTTTTTSSTSTTSERGVSGGHFDFDIFCKTNCTLPTVQNPNGQYYSTGGTDAKNLKYAHVHEYDDTFDVTGVNMLSPSENAFKLSNVKIGTVAFPATTSFKVLIHNQAYSPAAKFSVGGNPYVNVYEYQVASGLTVASLPSYTLATVGTLKFNLPLDAFKSKDWGTGVVRAGLHPIMWSCAVSNAKNGPLGERRNGALTFQIINASVTDGDIQLNVPNRPDLGYRLKDTSESSKLIAEYTTYWHHPSDKCMGDTGWKMNAAEDTTSDATAKTPATGSSDPKDGIFGLTGVPIGGGAAGSSVTDTVTTTTTTNNSNGTVTTTTTTVVTTTTTNSDGSKTTKVDTTIKKTTTDVSNGETGVETGGGLDGAPSGGPPPEGEKGPAFVVGRINWRELQR
jgi:Neisseria PilC beta-propeller domain